MTELAESMLAKAKNEWINTLFSIGCYDIDFHKPVFPQEGYENYRAITWQKSGLLYHACIQKTDGTVVFPPHNLLALMDESDRTIL